MTTLHLSLRRPGAFVPVVMSLVALALVFGQIAFVGTARQADEGAVAHLWQILIAGQLPIIGFFAVRFLPQQPKQTLLVLALQVIAMLAACVPVFLLHW